MTHLSVARHFYATQCSEEMVQMPHMSESALLCQSLRTPLFQDESEFALNEEKNYHSCWLEFWMQLHKCSLSDHYPISQNSSFSFTGTMHAVITQVTDSYVPRETKNSNLAMLPSYIMSYLYNIYMYLAFTTLASILYAN